LTFLWDLTALPSRDYLKQVAWYRVAKLFLVEFSFFRLVLFWKSMLLNSF